MNEGSIRPHASGIHKSQTPVIESTLCKIATILYNLVRLLKDFQILKVKLRLLMSGQVGFPDRRDVGGGVRTRSSGQTAFENQLNASVRQMSVFLH